MIFRCTSMVSFVLCLLSGAVTAESLVASRTMRPRTLISENDVSLVNEKIAGALSSVEEAIGLEARTTLYAGRPIRREDLSRPALIERNQMVKMVYSYGQFFISTEGRSLDRAGIGDRVRVMNLSSRSIVVGYVDEAGRIVIQKNEKFGEEQ